MHFDLDDLQYEFRDAVRKVLSAELPAARLRSIWEEGHGYSTSVWPHLVSLGLPGLLVPAAHGGGDGTPVDLVLLLEECGYACLPEPIVETALIAPLVLSRFGTEQLQAAWLPRLAEGEAIVATCLGEERLVADGARADAVLVRQGDELHWVPRSAVLATPVEGIDPSRRLAACAFDLGPDTLLAAGPEAVRAAQDAGAFGTAALLVGLAQRLTETTRDYLLERRQFGRVIGSFQALKHRLADVAVQTEAARSLVWYASYALAEGSADASRAVHMAKAAANEAAFAANYAALQLHGGIGFTWEHDLHFWLQRGKALERAFGSTAQHRAALADDVLAEVWS
jgi:alkylation response protein AidB-like acyl-CoA dehydrogenase